MVKIMEKQVLCAAKPTHGYDDMKNCVGLCVNSIQWWVSVFVLQELHNLWLHVLSAFKLCHVYEGNEV